MVVKNSKRKKTVSYRQWFISLKIILFIVCADILIKELVQRKLFFTSGNNFFDVTYAQNTGTMWSLFANIASVNTIFIALSFLALGFLIYYLRSESKHTVPVSIIAAGVLGNLSDRIHYGYVIDWANFHFFPIFNIADASIVCGVAWLVFLLLKEDTKQLIASTQK